MSKINIKYFAIAPAADGAKEYKKEIKPLNSKGYATREEFSKQFGDPAMILGEKCHFPLRQIIAEPKKKHSILEIIISLLFTMSLMYFVPGDDVQISKARWAIVIVLSYFVGLLLGRLRIDLQRAEADFFNRS